jgi:hypothetical protein
MEWFKEIAAVALLSGWSIIGIYIATELRGVCKAVEGLKSDIRVAGSDFKNTKELVSEHKMEIYDLRERVIKLERS